MKFFISALAAALALVAMPASARVAQGRVVEIEVPAPSLEGNLLNTPTTQAAAVYLPPSYGRGARHYPVIYLLHGIADSHRTWLDYIGVKAILDRTIAAGRMPESIVVMPDGFNVYGGGFYRNSSVSGRWEDFVADDLIGFVDARYRTIANANGRALIGWSMGGYGALSVAMNRPGIYSSVYAISPCCLALVADIGPENDAWNRVLALHDPAEALALAQSDFYVVAILGLLSAFDPDETAPPLYVHFPFRSENGALTPTPSYDRFAAQFPVNRIAQSRDALMGLRALGFDYGTSDQFAHIPLSTRLFSERLAEAGVPHRFEVYDGDHRQRVAERLEAVVLPYAASVLDRPR